MPSPADLREEGIGLPLSLDCEFVRPRAHTYWVNKDCFLQGCHRACSQMENIRWPPACGLMLANARLLSVE